MKKNKKVVKQTTKTTVTKKPIIKKLSKRAQIKKTLTEYLEKRNNKIIVGNWKTNKNFKEIKEYASEFNMLMRKDKVLKNLNFIIGVAPTMIGLIPAAAMMNKHAEMVAQYVTYQEKGAFTGQVSYAQVHEYNVNYCIVGHSESRKNLNVTDTFCRDSIRALLKAGMRPILCVGEDEKQYTSGKSHNVVLLELMNCLKELTEDEVRQVIIAYEPIWAIGQKVARPEWIVDMSTFIRNSVADLFNATVAKDVHVLYGGSVTPDNSKEILSLSGVDGVLIGGASLKANKFYQIICSAPEYAFASKLLFPPKPEKVKKNKEVK